MQMTVLLAGYPTVAFETAAFTFFAAALVKTGITISRLNCMS
jgi:hypothetical protein